MRLHRRWMLAIAVATVCRTGIAQANGFRSSDVGSPDTPSVQAVAHMSDLMRQRSGGRLFIGSLGASDQDSESFTVAQVRTGTLDMARVSVSALHGTVPATVIPTLPFLFASTEHRRRSLQGPVGEELLAALTAVDLVGLCFYDAGPRSIYTPARAVRTPADMKGLKIRIQTSSAITEIMQALGAQPIPIPFAQVRPRLAAGTVDAAENNLISYLTSRHYEVAKVYSVTEHVASPAVVIFSRQAWNRLPKEDQAIIRQAARDSVAHHRKVFDEQEAAARATLTAAGIQFVTDVDKAAFAKVLAPLYPRLVTDPRHRALIERIQAGE
ncbi:TRAP transporter substrate-binding protein [Reyranella soli]|uniref:C4-dicarboxylate ABC transporter n=1 Tax=Reyranella soli TaxID=1230389 RepID=A0A512NDR8_9HYPH|nr:TRAP transporter substrate-binding protein [Reyranella soli]GEP57073.1 C4-dicarboxylate ABC transporter [Reyranella soli]